MQAYHAALCNSNVVGFGQLVHMPSQTKYCPSNLHLWADLLISLLFHYTVFFHGGGGSRVSQAKWRHTVR